MTFKFFDKLSQDFSELLNDKKEYNVVIEVDIRNLLLHIQLSYVIVHSTLINTKTVYELMVNDNELELKELSVKLESYLIESRDSWLRTHFSLVYRSIFDNIQFKDLKKFYNDIIVKYPKMIFDSRDFTSLQETALVSILKRDDLKVEEMKIWDYSSQCSSVIQCCLLFQYSSTSVF
ncbi:hypothetical protein Glove_159g14 [Diversispora epigaea]|uniref:BACK domain-containing protein n=1 Tax=Diversispora epigaea TaxID=1348612 RepID=A0A397J0G7_9GLOM|nr:hypothetical protein Glove_159g14 [Diversispora epigaea]